MNSLTGSYLPGGTCQAGGCQRSALRSV